MYEAREHDSGLLGVWCVERQAVVGVAALFSTCAPILSRIEHRCADHLYARCVRRKHLPSIRNQVQAATRRCASTARRERDVSAQSGARTGLRRLGECASVRAGRCIGEARGALIARKRLCARYGARDTFCTRRLAGGQHATGCVQCGAWCSRNRFRLDVDAVLTRVRVQTRRRPCLGASSRNVHRACDMHRAHQGTYESAALWTRRSDSRLSVLGSCDVRST